MSTQYTYSVTAYKVTIWGPASGVIELMDDEEMSAISTSVTQLPAPEYFGEVALTSCGRNLLRCG